MLKAGFARIDVTPPLGSFLAGDFNARYSEDVFDPIYLNALSIELGEEKMVLIACDFLMIEMSYSDKIRKKISERIGIDVNNIILTSLHQHTSISLKKGKYNNVLEDYAYLDVLYRKFCDVAVMAVNDMKEASLAVGQKETDEQISFIRRYYMKDGTVATNPGGRHLEVDCPCCEADNVVRLVKFTRENASDIALVNFSTHACVTHELVNSAEWPGFARTYIEQDVENVNCIFTIGFEGDSNHCDFTKEEIKSGYEHSKHMGRVIADTVVKIWNNTERVTPSCLKSENDIIYNRTRTDGEEDYESAVKLYNDYHNGKLKDIDYTVVGNASRIQRMKNEPLYQKVPVTVINLGLIGFVGLGGEPFTEYGVKIRERCKERFIVTLCLTNGGQGYLPTKKAFEEGGYETACSSFNPDIEKQCTDKAIELLNKQ